MNPKPVRNIDEEIKEILEQSLRTRYQFLRAELETCFTALDMARYELSVGNMAITLREIASVKAGIQALERFLPDIPAGQQKAIIETRLTKLQAGLDSLKRDVGE